MENLIQIKAVMYEAYAGTRGWALNHIVVYPFLEIVFIGFFTKYLLKLGTDIKVVTFLAMIPIVAQAIQTLNLRFVINYQQHLWQGTGIHIATSSIKKINWVIGSFLYAITMMTITVFVMISNYILFIGYPLNSLFKWLPLIISASILISFSIGIFSIMTTILFGQKAAEVVWMSPIVLSIISGLQYPITVLPNWLAAIARFSPMQPLYEGIRRIIYGQEGVAANLIRANISGIIWAIIMLILIRFALKNFYNNGKVSYY